MSKELYRLGHSKEGVALLRDVERVVVSELLDQIHLGFEIFDPGFHYDVHEDSKVLVRGQVKLVGLDLDSVPELLNGRVNCLADLGY